MLDDGESLRALRFAPLALVVLEHNGSIKMVNRLAESILGTSDVISHGKRLESHIASSSIKIFTSALNEASDKCAASTSGVIQPIQACVELQSKDQPSLGIWLDLCITSWYSHDDLQETCPNSSDGSSLNANNQNATSAALNNITAPHEAFCTISMSLSPSRGGFEAQTLTRTKDEPEVLQVGSALRDSVFQYMDTAVLAFSKDGKFEIRNRACDEIFSSLGHSNQHTRTSSPDCNAAAADGILPWLQSTAYVYAGTDFEKDSLAPAEQ
jgi:hypothetical protein